MIKKRLFGILLSLALIFGMMPSLGLPVYAEGKNRKNLPLILEQKFIPEIILRSAQLIRETMMDLI